MSRSLSSEAISLVHQIELNKSGWHDKALYRFIMTALYSIKSHSTSKDVHAWITDNISDAFNIIKIQECIEIMLKNGEIIATDNQKYKLSENTINEFATAITDGKKIERKVEERFNTLAQSELPEPIHSGLWERFKSEFWGQYVSSMGAKTMKLLDGSGKIEANNHLERFLEGFPSDFRNSINNTIIKWMDPEDTDVRSYTVRNINAYFFAESIGLSESTLRHVTQFISKKTPLYIFIDTNLLFSMLELHDNPANDAAERLLSLTKKLKDTIKLKLYIAPMTREETLGVLIRQGEKLKQLNITSAMRSAALNRDDLSGFTKKYLLNCEAAGCKIPTDTYIKPYIDDLLTVTRSKGIDLYNSKWQHYKKDQSVIDDIMLRLNHEQSKYKDDAKSYETIEHDVTLMHFVSDLRPKTFETPLEAQFWIATIDYRLLGHDRFISETAHRHSICAHPSSLIQMLQMLLPRTDDLEKTLVSNMRLPFFLGIGFDTEAENVTFNILAALSRYENIEDLDEETISKILISENLRQRIRSEKNIESYIESVKLEIISEVTELKEKISTTQNALDLANQKNSKLSVAYNNTLQDYAKLKNLLKEATTANNETKNLHEKTIRDVHKLTEEVSKLQNTTEEASSKYNELKTSIYIKGKLRPLFIAPLVLISLYVFYFFQLRPTYSTHHATLTLAFIALGIIWAFATKHIIQSNKHLADDYTSKKLLFVAKTIIWILLVCIIPTVISIFANIATPTIQNTIFPPQP